MFLDITDCPTRSIYFEVGVSCKMARHRLNRGEQAEGLRKALRSRKTPPWLKPSIRRFLRKLEAGRTPARNKRLHPET